jgi:hypothetical protein
LLVVAIPAICDTPEQRAVQYLTREVPRWAAENKCYSCDNDGDGARALYAAARLRYRVSKEALAGTTRWLLEPRDWDKTRTDAAISDKKLARTQFAASLAEAYDAGLVSDRAPLIKAAASLVRDQSGSPVIVEQTNAPPRFPTLHRGRKLEIELELIHRNNVDGRIDSLHACGRGGIRPRSLKRGLNSGLAGQFEHCAHQNARGYRETRLKHQRSLLQRTRTHHGRYVARSCIDVEIAAWHPT